MQRLIDRVQPWIEWVAQAVEIMAVSLIGAFIAIGAARWLLQSRHDARLAYESFRVLIAKAMLLGLELLVAADIIRTVTLELTLERMGALAALVALRTLLAWSLTVEIEGRWPWQSEAKSTRTQA